MRRTTPLIIAAAAVSSLLLAACGGDTEASADGTDRSLVVYSNSVSDGRGDWLAARAADEGFDLEFVDLGGGDIQNRLLAEANNPIADVTFGLNNVYFEKLKAAGVLEPYTPAWSSQVDPEVADGDEAHFWPIIREPIMGVYSLDAYPDGRGAPQDWPDLWEDPAYHGRYETPTGLGGATTQMVLTGILTRYQDDAGTLGISDDGWAAVESFFAHGSPAVQGTDLFARMAAGEVDLGQMWLAGKASREAEYGVPTEAMRPEGGVPMVYQHVGLVAGTDNAETAQEFIDWFGSADVQAAWSQEFFTAPANQDALLDADQDAVEQTDSFTEQDIDWPFVAEHIDLWVEEIELNHLP